MSGYGDSFGDLVDAANRIASSLDEITAGVTELANTKRVREINLAYIAAQTEADR